MFGGNSRTFMQGVDVNFVVDVPDVNIDVPDDGVIDVPDVDAETDADVTECDKVECPICEPQSTTPLTPPPLQ